MHDIMTLATITRFNRSPVFIAMMSSWWILLTVFVYHSVAADSSTTTDLLWPLPNDVQAGNGTYSLDPSKFAFTANGQGGSSDILKEAFQRYMELIFKCPTPFYPSGGSATPSKELSGLAVTVSSNDETLGLDTNESYTLSTEAGTLTANTVYGALKGLETFSQLVYKTPDEKFQISQVTVNDMPRFKFRGSMIDTARHYLQLQTILDHLDSLSYNKFNVLHWHIVDDQSFPYTSKKFPDMTTKGAYDSNHVYTQDQIQQVIKYAKYRGIRVIIEFDTPGHTQSWGKGQPNLLTECYRDGKPSGDYGPINPTLDSTWSFLKEFFGEISSVFPDEYLHLGGDEVSFGCWQGNPQIQKWMSDHNMTDYSKLEEYYETNLLQLIASLKKQYIVWQEIFDNNLKVLPDTVMHVWKGNWEKEMFSITSQGLKVILSSCWYLNYISYGADWKKYYTCEPQAFNGTAAQNALVVGGEVCMWAEFVDTTNFLARYWPRAGAVGERLWSKQEVNNTDAAAPRLHNQRCRMLSRGIPAEPAMGPSFCNYEWPGNKP